MSAVHNGQSQTPRKYCVRVKKVREDGLCALARVTEHALSAWAVGWQVGAVCMRTGMRVDVLCACEEGWRGGLVCECTGPAWVYCVQCVER